MPGAVLVTPEQQERELLAADAGQDLSGARPGLPAVRTQLQDRVASGLPGDIVELLVVVEVDHHDGRKLVAPRLDGTRGALGPAAAVEQAGERITVGGVGAHACARVAVMS
jgi:hypothetical protein